MDKECKELCVYDIYKYKSYGYFHLASKHSLFGILYPFN